MNPTLPSRFATVVLILGLSIWTGCSPQAEVAEPAAEPTLEEDTGETGLPEPESPQVDAEVAGAEVSGHATIELRIDRTQDLAGMQLVLVPPETANVIKTVRDERWLELASRFSFDDGYHNLDIQTIGYTAVQAAVARTRADAEGRFRFVGVQPGSYLIYGQYRSRYAVAYWLVPVEIGSVDDRIEIDINNNNFKEVHNLKMR